MDIDLTVRVAGLLAAVHGMGPGAIVALRRRHLVIDGGRLTIRTDGGKEIFIDDHVAGLLAQLSNHIGFGSQSGADDDAWLFPGRDPRDPLLAHSLSRLLKRTTTEKPRRIYLAATARAAHRFLSITIKSQAVHIGITGASDMTVYEYRRHVGAQVRERMDAMLDAHWDGVR
jgi:integrase